MEDYDEYETIHPNFKSLIPKVQNFTDIEQIIYKPLLYQDGFSISTTPLEMRNWNDKLPDQLITIKNIDRLYDIGYINTINDDHYFNLIARMEYKNNPLYVEMRAHDDNYESGGYIYISKDANIFMNVVLSGIYDIKTKNRIYESLREDGVYVKEEEEEEDKEKNIKKTMPNTLSYYCHKIIYKNKDTLNDYISQLPKCLKKSIDEFIKVSEAKEDYYDDISYIKLEIKSGYN